jgi:DNA-binding CsgD family transcriptional regulator
MMSVIMMIPTAFPQTPPAIENFENFGDDTDQLLWSPSQFFPLDDVNAVAQKTFGQEGYPSPAETSAVKQGKETEGDEYSPAVYTNALNAEDVTYEWTQEAHTALVQSYCRGKTYRQIGRQLGLSATAVRTHLSSLQALGLLPQKTRKDEPSIMLNENILPPIQKEHKWTEEDHARIEVLTSEGKTDTEIAAIFNTSRHNIQKRKRLIRQSKIDFFQCLGLKILEN